MAGLLAYSARSLALHLCYATLTLLLRDGRAMFLLLERRLIVRPGLGDLRSILLGLRDQGAVLFVLLGNERLHLQGNILITRVLQVRLLLVRVLTVAIISAASERRPERLSRCIQVIATRARSRVVTGLTRRCSSQHGDLRYSRQHRILQGFIFVAVTGT